MYLTKIDYLLAKATVFFRPDTIFFRGWEIGFPAQVCYTEVGEAEERSENG